MEAPLEIRYAGVVIGRAQEVRSAEGNPLSFFIPARDPMPVGTVLRMQSGDQETPVRVVRAVEAADAAICGMHVKTIGDAEEVAPEFIPPPVAVGEKPKPGTPAPVVEPDLAGMRAGSPAVEMAARASLPAIITIPAPARVPAPAAKATEAVPEAPGAGTSGEVAAVPEAVPVAVGSSMTGALRNATEPAAITRSASQVPIVQASFQGSEPASAPPQSEPDSSSGRNATQAYGTAVVTATAADTGSAAVTTGQPSGEDLPPARPISGPSGRRKTKRRK